MEIFITFIFVLVLIVLILILKLKFNFKDKKNTSKKGGVTSPREDGHPSPPEDEEHKHNN